MTNETVEAIRKIFGHKKPLIIWDVREGGNQVYKKLAEVKK
jgi:hypothetical protein